MRLHKTTPHDRKGYPHSSNPKENHNSQSLQPETQKLSSFVSEQTRQNRVSQFPLTRPSDTKSSNTSLSKFITHEIAPESKDSVQMEMIGIQQITKSQLPSNSACRGAPPKREDRPRGKRPREISTSRPVMTPNYSRPGVERISFYNTQNTIIDLESDPVEFSEQTLGAMDRMQRKSIFDNFLQMKGNYSKETAPRKKRRLRPRACDACRIRKIRCCRKRPCDQCASRNEICESPIVSPVAYSKREDQRSVPHDVNDQNPPHGFTIPVHLNIDPSGSQNLIDASVYNAKANLIDYTNSSPFEDSH
mmetsp:Transcript_1222/g.2828  ORF Transcript_1222/g.2828 Transcript_1222/m.2828 type:complete len:305 (+) Transcript_1222:83-997(+)